MRVFIISLVIISNSLYCCAQKPNWGTFHHLVNKTWSADGAWGNGSKFKQEITFSFGLKDQIIIAESTGYTDEAQTDYGHRNHGIRMYDAEEKGFRFWEYDVFGGVTKGTIEITDSSILYQYVYGDSKLTDMWSYLDENSYRFTVGAYADGVWKQKFLETTFKSINSPKSSINQIAQHLIGSWSASAWDGILSEQWRQNGDRLEQTSSYAENGKVSYSANSYIEMKEGELILTSIIKDGNPKIFKAVSINQDAIIFENSDYINPSKVTYSFLNGTFHRTIEGLENDKPSTYTFEFKAAN